MDATKNLDCYRGSALDVNDLTTNRVRCANPIEDIALRSPDDATGLDKCVNEVARRSTHQGPRELFVAADRDKWKARNRRAHDIESMVITMRSAMVMSIVIESFVAIAWALTETSRCTLAVELNLKKNFRRSEARLRTGQEQGISFGALRRTHHEAEAPKTGGGADLFPMLLRPVEFFT